MKAQINKKGECQIVVSNQFVSNNFHEEFVSKAVSLSKEGGWFKTEKEHQKLDVLKLDNDDQVRSLLYTKFDKRGKWNREGIWYVAFADTQKEPEEVTEEWVKENFTTKFIRLVKGQPAKNNVFVDVPVGSVNKMSNDDENDEDENAPDVFLQKDNNVCMSHSLASALLFYDAGLSSLCHTIRMYQRGNKNAYANSWDHFVEFLQSKLQSYVLLPMDSTNFDPLTDRSGYVKLCVLKSKQLSVDHAVSFIDEWTFDSNKRKAQRTTRQVLDWCCMGNYMCIEKGICVIPNKLYYGLNLEHRGRDHNKVAHCLFMFFNLLGETKLSVTFDHIRRKKPTNKPFPTVINAFHKDTNCKTYFQSSFIKKIFHLKRFAIRVK